MSKLIIEKCRSENITPNEFLLLYNLVSLPHIAAKDYLQSSVDVMSVLNSLKSRKYVDDKNKATNKGNRLIVDYEEEMSILEGNKAKADKKLKNKVNEKEIDSYIDEYRELFKGLKPGSMGDKHACKKKLLQFYEQYPEYGNKELILSATKRYINSLNDYTYLKQADYFIFKQDYSKVDKSMLASYCEEIDMGAVEEDRISFKNTKMV